MQYSQLKKKAEEVASNLDELLKKTKKLKSFNYLNKIQNLQQRINNSNGDLTFHFISLLKKRIPFLAIPTVGKVVGNFAYRFFNKRRNTAFRQLKIAFPAWSSSKIQKTALLSFQNLAQTATEIIKKQQYSDKVKEFVKNENQSVLESFKKTGGILVGGHFGNWEFGTYSFELAKIKGIIVGKAENKSIKLIIEHFRKAKGWENITIDNPSLPFKMVKTLKNNKFICMIVDTDTSVESVFCNFFGKKTRVIVSPARLALKYQKPIISFFNHRDSKNRLIFNYKVVSQPPYPKNFNEETLAQKYTTAIEEYIKKYPAQWRWFENRWKTEKWDDFAARFKKNIQ